jgi:predicted secreted protein
MAAFDRSRELAIPTPEPEIEVVEESTEEVVARFQGRAQHLTSAALTSAYVVSEITNGPIHVTRPKESAEELFALATN